MADDTYVVFDTNLGNFVVELYNSVAPLTVANFLSYVENPTAGDNYNDGFFHRLVQGFVLQGGGYDVINGTVDTIPTSSPVTSEYNANYPNVEGSLAMALTTGPNTATDEFFFNLGDNSSLLDGTADNGPFTVFGKVAENWNVVESIASLPTIDVGSPFTGLPVENGVSATTATTGDVVTYTISVVTPITGTVAAQSVLDDGTISPFSTVALSDPGNPVGEGDELAITIVGPSGAATSSYGKLTLSAAGAASGLTLTSTGLGTYLLSAAASIAILQTALDDIVFTPSELPTTASATVTLDLALLSNGGTLGTIDNSGVSVVISHDLASQTAVTVAGAGGTAHTLTFNSVAQSAQATTLLAGVVASTALFADSAGAVAMTAAQTAAIDDANGAVTVAGNGAANETIAAGSGAFTFDAGAGSGTVLAGDGADFIYLQGGGNWFADLGNGADTVVAGTGADTISTGVGGNLIFLGAGASSLASFGADTIIGGAGSATIGAAGSSLYFSEGGATLFNANGAADTITGAGAETVNAGAANMLAFGGTDSTGGLDFTAGSGASTVVSYAGGGTLNGGAGATLYFAIGPTSYNAGTASDTVIGYGAMTATGGAGGTQFFAVSKGGNVITTGAGETTIVGFGAGDAYNATNAATDVIEAAGSAVAATINGAASSGADDFFAFGNNQVIYAGSGADIVESAFGNQTLVGGSGASTFFIENSDTVRAVTLTNFNPALDSINLTGYASDAGATALQSAVVSGGNETLTLADGSSVTFIGITNLAASVFG